jgi:hypothetical protein
MRLKAITRMTKIKRKGCTQHGNEVIDVEGVMRSHEAK